MNPVDLGFKPLPDTPEQRARLAQQRAREQQFRLALTILATCPPRRRRWWRR